MLETKRLVLRAITLDDASDMLEYSRSELVGPAAGWKPHESIEETRDIIKEIFLDKKDIFGLCLKTTGKLIGSAGLMNDPKRQNERVKMLGYALGCDYWRKGYMSEAVDAILAYGFSQLNLTMISACCYPHNLPSRSLLKKLGFEYEGTLRQAETLYNGNVYDHECYALRAESFLK